MDRAFCANRKEDHLALYVDLENLGLSLRELAVDLVPNQKNEFLCRWFHSPKKEADLFIWFDRENRMVKHHISFYGQVVEWNPIYGTRSGVIIEEEIDANMALSSGHDDEIEFNEYGEVRFSEKIQFDLQTQKESVIQAIKIISFVPELSDLDRDIIIYNYRHSPKMHKKAKERALREWQINETEFGTSVRSPFWKRIKKWVLGR